jgi:YihY family inner membrane protein
MTRLLQRLFEALERGRRFVTHDVWRIGRPGEQVPHGLIIKHIRVVILLVQGLFRDDLLLRASSLTFATILAIVPFLAIMFFIIQTFNVGGAIADLLAPVTAPISRTSSNGGEGGPQSPATQPGAAVPQQGVPQPGAGLSQQGVPQPGAAVPQQLLSEEQKNEQLRNQLVAFLFRGFENDSNTAANQHLKNPVTFILEQAQRGSNPRTLTLAGLVFVLTTIFGLMLNIEYSFNKIWGVKRSRSWYRMVSDYIMILLLLPFLAAGVLTVTSALEHSIISERLGQFGFALQGIQYAVSWLVFTALYFYVPNTRVRFRYALLAGLVAGTMWCLLSLGYVKFQFGLARYGLLYSTFAQIPVFLMWVYFSWLVLLLGAEIAFAYQNEKTFAMERLAEGAPYAYKEAVAVWAMIEACKHFDAGLCGLGAEQAAEEWNVPLRLLNEILQQLEEGGLVVRSASKPPTYQPGRSVDKITVGDVVACLRESGKDPSALRQDGAYKRIMEHLGARTSGPSECTIAELIRSG